jgi:DNA-directed RNA polymerase specialized sigma24 family protein
VLEEAFELHHADLCAFAVTLLRDRDAADDVVGEAFAALQREMAADRTPKELRGWLHSVVASTPTTIGSIS